MSITARQKSWNCADYQSALRGFETKGHLSFCYCKHVVPHARQRAMKSHPEPIEPAQCPLCGGANECQLASAAAYKGQCWCEHAQIPEALLARVPIDLRNKSCICQKCVAEFHRSKNPSAPQDVLPGDTYIEDGKVVFTAAYHLRRGYCCGSGCRHCPFPKAPPA